MMPKKDFYVNQSVKDKDELLYIMKNAVTLELHVEDFEPVRDFYKKIGFEILFDSPGNYLTIRHDKVILSFWGDGGRFKDQPYFKNFPADTKKGFAVEIRIPVDDIDGMWEKVKNIAEVKTPLKEKRWGARDFRVLDVNGFYLCFTEKHDWIFNFGGYSTDKDD